MNEGQGDSDRLISLGETFLDGRVRLCCGDSRDVLKSIPDNSIDSVVCDPPYALMSIVKRFGAEDAAPVKAPEGGSGVYARASSGFMGQKWDTGDTAFAAEFWAEVLRVLKPGGHVVAFSGTRTYHRLACAIEDAGFEIRDQIQWMYGQGFPKSHNVAKGVDKLLGAEGKTVATGAAVKRMIPGADQNKDGWEKSNGREFIPHDYEPGSQAGSDFDGWGTALKPACEPICLGRKPLIGTVAANVLAHGTGALNIDGCRVGTDETIAATRNVVLGSSCGGVYAAANTPGVYVQKDGGRWPANVIHDGSAEVMEAFPQTSSGELLPHHKKSGEGLSGTSTFEIRDRTGEVAAVYGDSGSAARFFYTSKADADDRLGSKHPTVKPVDLMQWLCRLVTPKGGTVLDPFAGTGTTGEAAFREGFNAVLIEREAEYQDDIRRRMALAMSGPAERKREAIKAKTKGAVEDHGPLFGGA